MLPPGCLGRARRLVRRPREVDLLPARRQKSRVRAPATHAVGADPREEVDVGVGAAVAAAGGRCVAAALVDDARPENAAQRGRL